MKHRSRRAVATDPLPRTAPNGDLLEGVDFLRLDATRRLDPERRSEMGQFLTPAPTARLMASMFRLDADTYHLLDPGAGVGSLTAAWIAELCSRKRRPKSVAVTAYEVDELMLSYLDTTMKAWAAHCEAAAGRGGW